MYKEAPLFKTANNLISHLMGMHAVKFLIVGGIATGTQFVLLILFVELISIDEVAASAAAYGCAAIVNYFLNYYFTFNSNKSHKTAFAQFIIVAAIGLGINTLSFTLFNRILHYFLAQIMATLLTLISNFILHKYWIYKT